MQRSGDPVRPSKRTVVLARHLRREMSPPEARLWKNLRQRVPGQPVFRRQHPIGPYVLDFFCAKARLAVEIDGLAHDMADRPKRDLVRESWLTNLGITVLR